MTKIILIQINHSEDHSEKILPIGILSVGSALKKRGFTVELVNINEEEIDQTVDYVISEKPFYAGFSVMTGRQTMHSASMSRKLKERADIKIMWGGIHPSLLPEQCLSESYIDYIIMGEGEETAVEFSGRLERGEPLADILGLGHKESGAVKINPPRPMIKNLDDWPLDFSLIDLNKYIFRLDKFKRVIAYKASRGCPFNCAFCYNRAFNQSRWRAWSIGRVVSDIEFLKKNYQIDAVKFYDDNFFVDKDRALEILRRIDLPAHLEVRIDMIDKNIARALKKYQAFDLLIGIESGSDRLLKLINKNFTVERLITGVKILAEYDIPASYSVIVGLPTETKEEFEATIDLLYKIYKIHPRAAAFSLGAYMPYPGSLMYDFAVKQGFKPPLKTEDWGKIDRFRKDFSTPWADGEKVWRIREYFKLLKLKLGPVNKWLEFRIKHRWFAMPYDIYLIEYLAGVALEEKSWPGKVMRKIYNLMKK
ncbi:MAG: radical SAM protein [Patescibacteria group bacterium]|jgi:radical SAM superfamily enzyme YgiQ (UPF0313 family)